MGDIFATKYIKSHIPPLKSSILFLVVYISILLFSSVALAADVTLAWDASSRADGYRLFVREQGQSYNYSSPDWEGTVTTGTVTGLTQGTTYYFVVRAYNVYGESSDSNEESTTISSPNRPPVLGTIGSKSVDEGTPLTFTVTASDPDGDNLTFSASNVPTGASFNPSTRVFSWTPAFGDAGNYNVQFTVTDNGSPPESDLEIVNITVVDPSVGNLAPDQPVITSPYYGEVETDLLLTVETDPFSDPDGDTHKESRWQIIEQADSSVVLDITSTEHLTALPVPHMVLDRDTTYIVSVQFYDTYSEPSGWSDSIEFTTTSNIEDFDGDGIPDAHEVDDTVDLNGDGIPDNDQPDVIKSIRSAVGANEPFGVSKVSASIDAIELLEPINPAAILDKTNKPETFLYGLASYRLRLNQVGATVEVKIYYSEDISEVTHYYMYDAVQGWHDYTQHTVLNQDGRSITVEMKDGGHGDCDGVANGIIVDPGGVVAAAATGGLDSGAGGECFIATASFGSHVGPYKKLQAVSYDDGQDWLKPIIRFLLMPIVGIRYILMRTSPVIIILFFFVLIFSVLNFYALIKRRRKYQV